MAFRGHFDYSLDAKNRLTVPPRFRGAFSQGVVLAKGLDPCAEIWAPEAFEAYTESFLGGLNPVSSERRSLTRFFSGGSFDLELDAAGRVTLNKELLEHAGIEGREVTLIGVLNRVEIWDRSRWEERELELTPEVVEIAERLGNAS